MKLGIEAIKNIYLFIAIISLKNQSNRSMCINYFF